MPKVAEAGGDGSYSISNNDKAYQVNVKGGQATVNGANYKITFKMV